MRLNNPHYPHSQGALITPPNEGITLARGTTVPSGIAGYRPYGLFIGPDGIYQNEGSITSCSFVKIVALAPAAADVSLADGDGHTEETDVEGAVAEIYTALETIQAGTPITAPDGGSVDETYGSAEADVLANAVVRIEEIEQALIAANILAEPE